MPATNVDSLPMGSCVSRPNVTDFSVAKSISLPLNESCLLWIWMENELEWMVGLDWQQGDGQFEVHENAAVLYQSWSGTLKRRDFDKGMR